MKLAIGIVFLIISGLIVYFYLQPQPLSQTELTKVQALNGDIAAMEIEKSSSSERSPNQTPYQYDEQTNKPTEYTRSVLWRKAKDAKIKPGLRNDISDAELVEYDRAQLLKISAGAIVEVFLPHLNQSFAVSISSSELLASGNVNIKGNLASDDLFSFVMTLGEQSMFAMIETPEGVYNIGGNRQLAWVIPALSLRKHINTDVLDYRSIVPEVPPALLEENG